MDPLSMTYAAPAPAPIARVERTTVVQPVGQSDAGSAEMRTDRDTSQRALIAQSLVGASRAAEEDREAGKTGTQVAQTDEDGDGEPPPPERVMKPFGITMLPETVAAQKSDAAGEPGQTGNATADDEPVDAA